MANPQSISLHAAGAETVTGTGAAVDITALRQAAKLTLEITALAGTTPTLAVAIETSLSGAGSWQQVVAFASQNAVGTVELVTAKLRRYVRAVWTIGGTLGPSFTFALTGEAHQLYVTPDQAERIAVSTAALSTLSDQEKAEAAIGASSYAEGKIAGAFTMPISAWGDDVRRATADVYVWDALSKRGFNPEDNVLVLERKNDAIKWFGDVAAGRVKPPGIIDATPESYEAGSYVVSRARRGW